MEKGATLGVVSKFGILEFHGSSSCLKFWGIPQFEANPGTLILTVGGFLK
jgi:hypothetical protein